MLMLLMLMLMLMLILMLRGWWSVLKPLGKG
jgi:hypothetical protein